MFKIFESDTDFVLTFIRLNFFIGAHFVAQARNMSVGNRVQPSKSEEGFRWGKTIDSIT